MRILGSRKAGALAAFVLMAIAAMGARCIENDSSYVDDQGYTHIVGEMANDTDISATTVTLRGQLLDGQGSVIAETTGILCPETVQPKSRNTFDLKFATPNIGPFDHFEVRPISGSTTANTLRSSAVVVNNFESKRFGGTTAVRGDLLSSATSTYGSPSMCVAFYDASGIVVHTYSAPITGPLVPGTSLHFGATALVHGVPASAVTAAIWIVPASTTMWVTAGPVPIQ